jgi:hypothetical protein
MVGGDLIEIAFNHPTLGQGFIFAKAGESFKLVTGGYMSNDDDQGLATNGEVIDQMTLQRWSVEGVVGNDMNDRQELEKCVAMAGDTKAADWTISHINGSVYKGKGKPVGKLELDTQATTFTLKISGGGVLKQI